MPSKKVNVVLFSVHWGYGGTESFIMNLARGLDKSKFSFEVFTICSTNDAYDEELLTLGGKRTSVFQNCDVNVFWRIVRGSFEWSQWLMNNNVDVVHAHMCSATAYVYLAAAKMLRIPVRIAHSHCTGIQDGIKSLKGRAHRLCKRALRSCCTDRLACSYAAGKFMFANDMFFIVPNGIDISRFSFDVNKRNAIRKSLGIQPNTMLFGSIGRISCEKNPLYSVRVLKELLNLHVNSRLMLVGNGDMEREVDLLASELGVSENYTRIDSVQNPEYYYAALDVFFMPSCYEGLPYALLESQCNGLPSLVSNGISQKAVITDLVARFSIDDPPIMTAHRLIDVYERKAKSRQSLCNEYPHQVASAGFSMQTSVLEVTKYYTQRER